MKALRINKGQKFHRLTVVGERPKLGVSRMFLVKCICGNELVTRIASLRSGKAKSCGCLNRENILKNALKHGYSRRSTDRTKTYSTWAGVIQRCINKKNKSYSRYGGRGITVCKRWMKFENFLKDMGESPAGKSLDRIDNNRGYSKKNCKWSTPSEQGNNKRNNRFINYKGKTQTIAAWSRETGLSWDLIADRIKAGFTADQVFNHKKYANKRAEN